MLVGAGSYCCFHDPLLIEFVYARIAVILVAHWATPGLARPNLGGTQLL